MSIKNKNQKKKDHAQKLRVHAFSKIISFEQQSKKYKTCGREGTKGDISGNYNYGDEYD